MSNTIQFDYDIFYNYYTDTDNLEYIKNPPDSYYYPNNRDKIPKQKQLSHYFITINTTKIYIEPHGKNGFFFTIPEEIDNKLWDNHFHFGKEKNFELFNKKTRQKNNNQKYIAAVYFHKTIQNPEENKKDAKRCYYYPKMEMDMDTFEEIECIQSSDEMNKIFPKEDLVFIKEIIRRPFPFVQPPSFQDALLRTPNIQHHSSSHNHKNTKASSKNHRKGGTKKKTRKYRRKTVRRNRR
jgi:hypothetical protein